MTDSEEWRATSKERFRYIFEELLPELGNETRWGWIGRCLLSDLQVFLEGIQRHGGGGNVAFLILVGAAIDLLSDLHKGGTGREQNHTEAAVGFIKHYFPDHLRSLPRLFWESIRNGPTHVYLPKKLSCRRTTIIFTPLSPGGQSRIQRPKDNKDLDFQVIVSLRDLYDALSHAVAAYKKELITSSTLQDRFHKVWEKLFETYPMRGEDAAEERKYLRRNVPVGTEIRLFQNY